ncbi:MAG: hypothetical protein ACE366_00990 [Bradymonadia bacterium]
MAPVARFGFIVHPLTPFQRRLHGVRALDRHIAAGRPAGASPRPQSISTFLVEDPHGARVEGLLVGVPLLPEEMLTDQQRAVEAVTAAVHTCHAAGAQVVGLGAVAAVIGGQGKAVAAEAPCPVTTGNSFTALAAFQTWRHLQRALDHDGPVALMGAPGPVAGGILRMLLADRQSVTVVIPTPSKPLKRLVSTLGAEDRVTWCADPIEALREGLPLIAASSTGGRLSLSSLPSGAVVIDVAAPADVLMDGPAREDVLILDGEYVRLPRPVAGVQLWRRIYGLITGQHRHVFACFAEPMVLALSETFESFSLGRTVKGEQLTGLEQLALEHGFWVDQLFEAGRPLSAGRLDGFARRRRLSVASS